MTDEELKRMQDLREGCSYYRAYSTSLMKAMKESAIERGKLLSRIDELEDQRNKEQTLAKGDLKAYRKDVFVQKLEIENNKLKKDIEMLIYKLNKPK